MKKRLFLLLCGVMCLFLALCSCTDDTENDGHDHGNSNTGSSVTSDSPTNSDLSSGSNNTDTSGSNNTNDNTNNNTDNKNEVSAPETPCELNSTGHYWSKVSINKNTSASGTIAISGKCDLCGDELYKVATTLVDYEEWKNALSEEGLSSFTAVSGNEYTDYSKNGVMSWRVDEKGTYTADYYINVSGKNSVEYAQNFKGFALQYSSFEYDSISKTYVYWINEKSYVELGFADGKLISHSTCTVKDSHEEKSTTLYLNHQRVGVFCPDFIVQKFDNAVTLEKLKASNVSSTIAEGIFDQLSSFSFNGELEISMLENDEVSIYFYLNSAGKSPISGEDYYTATVIIIDGYVTSVSFGSSSTELKYN